MYNTRKILIVALIFGYLAGSAGGLLWESKQYPASVFQDYVSSKTLNMLPVLGMNKRDKAPLRAYALLLQNKSPALAAKMDWSIKRAFVVHGLIGMLFFFLGFSFLRGGQK